MKCTGYLAYFEPHPQKLTKMKIYTSHKDLDKNISDERWLEGRKILAPLNVQVDQLNNVMENKMSAIAQKLNSSDTLEDSKDLTRFSIEYLNSLKPTGLPNSSILLKPGMPLNLIRNLNPKDGLCNGTILIFLSSVSNKLLKCKISGTERIVLIPRINFNPKKNEYPLNWSRRQFPVRVGFASTINKAQGKIILW